MSVEALHCKECGAEYALEARYVCERCFGPLEVRYDLSALDAGERQAADPGRAAEHLALRGLPAVRPDAALRAAGRLHAAGARRPRLAERLGLREVWVKNDAANPTHSFKDRVVTVALAKARELGYEVVACASTGNLANAVAAHAAAAGLESYVFIPADLEEQKILATGVYGTKLVAVRGNYDDVNRLCTELSAERDWAFVNVNVRPYYAEGSKTLGLRDRRAARLRAARPGRRADRLRLAVHEDRARLRRVARGRPRRGRPADDERRPGRGLLAGRARLRRRAGTSAARSSRDTIAKSLAIGNPADGPYALELARATGGSIDAVTDDEIRAGHPAAGRDHRHLHRDRRRRHHGDAREAGRARRHRPRRARRAGHHRRGPEDARRRARAASRPRDRAPVDSFEAGVEARAGSAVRSADAGCV